MDPDDNGNAFGQEKLNEYDGSKERTENKNENLINISMDTQM